MQNFFTKEMACSVPLAECADDGYYLSNNRLCDHGLSSRFERDLGALVVVGSLKRRLVVMFRYGAAQPALGGLCQPSDASDGNHVRHR